MGPQLDWQTARALLEWQVEMGATEAILDAPVDRYALDAAPAAPAKAAPAGRVPDQTDGATDPVAAARQAADAAADLAGLAAAVAAFPFCELRRGARLTVFAGGRPGARVLVVGEAPDRDEDRAGEPFRGAVEPLFDRMFAAIGLSRDAAERAEALYLTTALPWRLPGRAASDEEIAMLAPFLARHVALARPEVVVCMGALPCRMLLGVSGVGAARGGWREAAGVPALAMHHPATLMRRPEAKRDAWADLLALQERLEAGETPLRSVHPA